MDDKLASISEFADIPGLHPSAVKTYSTGMMMRVAFAVAVAVEPDAHHR